MRYIFLTKLKVRNLNILPPIRRFLGLSELRNPNDDFSKIVEKVGETPIADSIVKENFSFFFMSAIGDRRSPNDSNRPKVR